MPLTIEPEIGLAGIDRSPVGAIEDMGAAFIYGDGIVVRPAVFDKKAKQNPEYEKELMCLKDFFLPLETYKIVEAKLSENDIKLRESKSILAAVLGGHANPDFGLVGRVGTEAIREKNRKIQGEKQGTRRFLRFLARHS